MSPGLPTIRRILILCFCAVVMAAVASTGGAAGRFFSVVDDLPIMPALSEVPGSAVVFSKPEGRIVEVAATGAVGRDAVLAFYRRTLPQLGWEPGAEDGWRREGERLHIAFRATPDGLLVQFSLVPR